MAPSTASHDTTPPRPLEKGRPQIQKATKLEKKSRKIITTFYLTKQ